MFQSLKVGELYDRPYLVKLLGYKTFHAISRGIVTPANSNVIIFFVTKYNQDVLPDYSNYIKDNYIFVEGEANHNHDDRILNAERKGDLIYMFYRERHHSSFVYYGQVKLINYKINKTRSSKFTFEFNNNAVTSEGAMATEARTHGNTEYEPDEEGRRKITHHIIYERSQKNRKKALEIHGVTCVVCGFNFNNIYGEELARNYIEVHHLESITKGRKKTNPKTDLMPVCSNCHSMLHRDRNRVIAIEELKHNINLIDE